MKKGFTLIEMLVVVAILVTLMAITFRIGAVVKNNAQRAETIDKMHRLENCLSGYYAAYGAYPPVQCHASRSINTPVRAGQQVRDGSSQEVNWNNENSAWLQVLAACRAQPLGMRFPFSEADGWNTFVKTVSDIMKERAASGKEVYRQYWEDPEVKATLLAGFDDGVTDNIGRFDGKEHMVEWTELQMFSFGLLSYLVPRYSMMMSGDETLFKNFDQWKVNNDPMPCDPFTGEKFNGDWAAFKQKVIEDPDRINLIPSQAVCARWLGNLERQCVASHATRIFGVDLWNRSDRSAGLSINNIGIVNMLFHPDENNYYKNQYLLDELTVDDGWGVEFFYYSPEPFQSYILWSSGPNTKTFPPWIQRGDLGEDATKLVTKWVEDDIMQMSH